MNPKRSNPTTPRHLRPTTRKWFSIVVEGYILEPHHVRILQTAAESWDRMTAARELIDRDGQTFTNRHGEPRPRPEIAIERDSRIAFLRSLRELALDVASPDSPRSPIIPGIHHLRRET